MREDRGLAQASGEPIPPWRRSQRPHGDLRLHMAMARAEGRASPELSRPPDGQHTQLRGPWALYRPRFVRHRIACYAARAADESWLWRMAAGVWNPCRSMSQVVL